MSQVYSYFLRAAAAGVMCVVAVTSPASSQQRTENLGMRCPEVPRCDCPHEKPCPEPPTCQNLYDKLKECSPLCTPKLCDGSGSVAPAKYDANRDCIVTAADAVAVTNYLNSGSSGRVDSSNGFYDTNGDGVVGPLDVLVVADLVNSFCQPPPTPAPTLTPTPAATACVVEFQFEHKNISGKKTSASVDLSGAPNFSCFNQLYGSAAGASWTLWSALLSKIGRVPSDYEKNKELINCTGGYGAAQGPHDHNTREYIGGGQANGNNGRLTPGCRYGSLYFNDKCELQKASDVTASTARCSAGAIKYFANIGTPISLVWSDEYRTEPSTIVSFKLNPYSKTPLWLWRGSAALPLLVYDPKRTGKVTSATQLFGSWSFGGREAEKQPWKDGFEALATLDTNSDGRIAGSELDVISLWFDANRDAVSQGGEVKTASDAGVSALFFTPDAEHGGVVVAKRGFERTVDGKAVVGVAVDWAERELVDTISLALDHAHSLGATGDALPQADVPSKTGASAPKGRLLNPRLMGSWAWEVKQPATGAGFLEFSQDENGVVTGVTFSQLGFLGIPNVREQVFFSYFVVEAGDEAKNSEFSFQVNGMEGAKLNNTAVLSDDGETLSGRTVVTGSGVSLTGSYEYQWVARRVR